MFYTVQTSMGMSNGTDKRFFEFDRAGSSVGELDGNSIPTATASYDAFGNRLSSSGSAWSSGGFAGDWGYLDDGPTGFQCVGRGPATLEEQVALKSQESGERKVILKGELHDARYAQTHENNCVLTCTCKR